MPDKDKSLNIEARYSLLLNILRASHFEWIRTVQRVYPGCDVNKLVLSFWDEVAKDTADAYLRTLDRGQPLAPQIARLIVKSSLAMGETATVLDDKESKVVIEHTSCPWWDWHKKIGHESLDRPGCDEWFRKVVHYVNAATGAKLRVTTECALPDGAASCRRVFWED